MPVHIVILSMNCTPSNLLAAANTISAGFARAVGQSYHCTSRLHYRRANGAHHGKGYTVSMAPDIMGSASSLLRAHLLRRAQLRAANARAATG